jgi:hypothetical protein
MTNPGISRTLLAVGRLAALAAITVFVFVAVHG